MPDTKQLRKAIGRIYKMDFLMLAKRKRELDKRYSFILKDDNHNPDEKIFVMKLLNNINGRLDTMDRNFEKKYYKMDKDELKLLKDNLDTTDKNNLKIYNESLKTKMKTLSDKSGSFSDSALSNMKELKKHISTNSRNSARLSKSNFDYKDLIDKKMQILLKKKMRCPLKKKITNVIYEDKYDNTHNKDYLTTTFTDQKSDFIVFNNFMEKYYNCICGIDKTFSNYNAFITVTISRSVAPISIPMRLRKKTHGSFIYEKIYKHFERGYKTYRKLYNGKEYQLFSHSIIPETLKKCKNRYFIFSMSFYNLNEKDQITNGHGNSIIFDLKEKRMIRFEPNGSIESDAINQNTIDKLLKRVASDLGYVYIAPIDFCPIVGPQHFEKNEILDKRSGFCFYFSILFTCYLLDYPGVSEKKIVKMMYNGANKRDSENDKTKRILNISNEIRRFMNFYMHNLKK